MSKETRKKTRFYSILVRVEADAATTERIYIEMELTVSTNSDNSLRLPLAIDTDCSQGKLTSTQTIAPVASNRADRSETNFSQFPSDDLIWK